MRRAIITPAVLAPAALDELKEWLAITTPRDDAALTQLLRAALDMCEAFTGQMPLAATCEEVLPASGCWQSLAARPILAVTGIEGVRADGARFALAPTDYAIELEAHGGAMVRILQAGSAGRVAVRFSAGMAADWASLPEGVRHGVVRLAAHNYRERETVSASSEPPAAVVALWRPWRRMRLA